MSNEEKTAPTFKIVDTSKSLTPHQDAAREAIAEGLRSVYTEINNPGPDGTLDRIRQAMLAAFHMSTAVERDNMVNEQVILNSAITSLAEILATLGMLYNMNEDDEVLLGRTLEIVAEVAKVTAANVRQARNSTFISFQDKMLRT